MNRTLPFLALATAGLLTLSACGSSGGTTTAGDQPAQQGYAGSGSGAATGSGGAGGPGQGGGMPGAFGKIAAKSGKTLQVQGTDSQVAVTYSAKTAITQEVTGSIKDVKVGTCVTVMPADAGSGSASGSASASASGPVTAGTIRITAAVKGSCEGGFGGRGFRRNGASGAPSGMPSNLPSDMPSDFPSGGASGGPSGGRMFGTSGKVTAVTADGFTVAAVTPGSTDTTRVSVKVGSSATVTATKSATASALKVGKCVSATGQTDDTGAVTASRISLSDPVDGECTGGFMGRSGGSR
ncbi:hypothetical protein AB3X52_02060 [Nocardioides sp. DS6]|uniref:DUF5666 domain-containing protein n=1 Tax=Nocardioides eburneus TaxID=3231482 RepID=A0ABV3STX1_9ACTN